MAAQLVYGGNPCPNQLCFTMDHDWLRALARYNRWMNRKIYSSVETLSTEERKRDRGAFFRSIHGTLNHILLADRVWLGRLTAKPLLQGELGPGGIVSLDQELYAEFSDLARERILTDAELLSWIEALHPDQLRSFFSYVRNGALSREPLWSILAHIFNHQTHHRGQVTTLLKQAGIDPGVTDLIAMLREEGI